MLAFALADVPIEVSAWLSLCRSCTLQADPLKGFGIGGGAMFKRNAEVRVCETYHIPQNES